MAKLEFPASCHIEKAFQFLCLLTSLFVRVTVLLQSSNAVGNFRPPKSGE